jgi:hypothetical protein
VTDNEINLNDDISNFAYTIFKNSEISNNQGHKSLLPQLNLSNTSDVILETIKSS